MVNTILFDLDDTLLDFKKAERIALTKTLLQIGIEVNEKILDRYSELNLAQWKLLEQGTLSKSEVKTRRYELLFDEFAITYSVEKTVHIYESMLSMGHYFIEGAEELLEDISGKYQLYLVTNGTASVQRGRLKSANISRYFIDVFISEEIGFHKPRKEYFDSCFAQIPGFQKEKTLIVGDSLTSDIQGGKNSGIRTVWFNPMRVPNYSDVIPDYEIRNLNEIKNIL